VLPFFFAGSFGARGDMPVTPAFSPDDPGLPGAFVAMLVYASRVRALLQYCQQYMIFLPQVRIVLDTDVMVAALRSNTGASRRLLISALSERFELLLSVPLMLEYEAVLKRPEHLRTAGATGEEVDTILDAIAAAGVPVTLNFSWRPELSDPADEMVLEAAVNGQADLVVTFNLTHLRHAARRFGMLAIRPSEALSILEV
jgi:putative PIN family toxin of toxin-antitoxin system